MSRPRKPLKSTEEKAIRLYLNDSFYQCLCTLEGICNCSPIETEKSIKEQKQQAKDMREAELRKTRANSLIK